MVWYQCSHYDISMEINIKFKVLRISHYLFIESCQYDCMVAPLGLLRNDWRKRQTVITTRMLRAVLNKSWKQHPTKQQLYSYLLSSREPSKKGKQDMLSIVLS